ncbi:MAG: beta-lactamase family protein [Anaerolineae bacterium]|nr:beta-lactamase family protein [Anaerolineae bacterium]
MALNIDDIIEAELKGLSTGAAVAVVQRGDVIHSKTYGLANIEWGIPVDPDTVFRLGGLTIPFTSVGFLMLVEQGKLHLDDALTKYLPNYPTSGHHVTLRHLMTQTSGIHSYTEVPDVFARLRRDMTPTQIAEEFGLKPFDFKPGSRFRFSNSNHFLIGLVIEQLMEMSYIDFMRQYVFAPLGMKQTYYLHHEKVIPKRASGYDLRPDGLLNGAYLNMDHAYANGALGSSLNDIIRFDKALREHTLLSPEMTAQMHTPAQTEDGLTYDYGMGWALHDFHGQKVAWHMGGSFGIFGFKTIVARFLDADLTVIILANRSDFNVTSMTSLIARHFLNTPTVQRRPYGLTVEGLRKCVGRYGADGFALDIEFAQNGQIAVNIGDQFRLLPLNRTSFYSPDNPDVLLTFSQEQNGVFTRLEVELPFRVRTTVLRQEKPKGKFAEKRDTREMIAPIEVLSLPPIHMM